ncbi:SAM-dependent methyltransferase [filamentous cyanobacterium CCP5]|nr:SAM-dependent methyltransferase [filamentous cyanobacterium CCP5]
MVFLCPQRQHDLIPQAHPPETDLALASEIKDFRTWMFQLFQQKISAAIATYPDEEDQDRLYAKIRPGLDNCPEIMVAHQRRGELQDQLWANVLEAIDRDRLRLDAVYNAHRSGSGRVELNSTLNIPVHQQKTHIHRMPGGYLQDLEADSYGSGLLYDHGVFLYGRGWFGPLNDELGQTVIHQVLNQHYPDFQPVNILDLGCSVGHSTLPYTSAYPEARVTGIDLGASLLRYGAARASVLGETVQFAQQNAESTDFGDRSLDLVVSHILLHEMPGAARRRVFAESYRLLKPGGLMVHLESQLFLEPPNLVGRYFRDTEVWANSEPYLASSKFEDFPRYALEAEFAPEAFQIYRVPGHYGSQNGDPTPRWIALCGTKN